MTFDGRNYTSIPIVGKYAHYPRADAAATALASSLACAYAVARTENRLIGVQTYRNAIGARKLIYDFFTYTNADELTDRARFRAYLPPYATHVVFEAHYRVVPNQSCRVKHRVRAVNGATNTVGATVDEPRPGLQDQTIAMVSPAEAYTAGLHVTRGEVTLAAGNQNAINRISIEGYAHTETSTTTAQRYMPDLYLAFWEVRG